MWAIAAQMIVFVPKELNFGTTRPDSAVAACHKDTSKLDPQNLVLCDNIRSRADAVR